MSNQNSYFSSTILLILLSIVAFIGLKAILPERLFPEQTVAANNKNIIIDNLLLDAIEADKVETESDSVKVDTEANDTLSAETGEPKTINNNATTEVDGSLNPTLSAEGYKNLSTFYTKLNELETQKKGNVRIAYFGDSMNDGDLIVQDIRQAFQDTYGGQGVGFVGITSLSAGARYSVSHQFSKDWRTESFVTAKKGSHTKYGISGQVFFGNDTTDTKSFWVKYKAQGQKHCTQLYNPTLYYGRSNNKNGSVTIETADGSKEIKSLNADKLLNKLSLSDTNQKQIKLTFNDIDSIPIYGVSFGNNTGVHVDNFSLRGNSGLPLSIFNSSLMNAFNSSFDYDLIVLQYGANVLSYTVESYGWYEKGMTRVVNNLRRSFPNAEILIISTADKATKIEEELASDPAVTLLLNAQKKYARSTGSGFINLYSLMGGDGSMIKWVDDGLAGKDYTHFNASGSKKVAKLIYNEIIKGYNLYKENKNSISEEVDSTSDASDIDINIEDNRDE